MVRIEIRMDRTAKVLLIVIAGCLVWQCVCGLCTLPGAFAQPASKPTTMAIKSDRMGDGPQGEEVIRARRFEIVDENGVTRAQLGLMDRNVRLGLADRSGQWRLYLQADDAGSGLTLQDVKGKTCFDISSISSIGTWMHMFEPANKAALSFWMMKDREPRMTFDDRNGETCVELAAKSTGSSLQITNGAEATVVLAASPDEASLSAQSKKGGFTRLLATSAGPKADLVDGGGICRAVISHDSEQGSSMQVCDEKGTARARLGAVTLKAQDGKKTIYPESTLTFFSPNSQLVRTLP